MTNPGCFKYRNKIIYPPGEYAAHKLISDAQPDPYASCYGTTNSAADLHVSAFFAYDLGALGIELLLHFTANGMEVLVVLLTNTNSTLHLHYGGGSRLNTNGEIIH